MLESWAYIAEIAGVITVVVTLAFLTVQIRQNTLALRSSATNEVHEQLARVYFDTSQNSETASIYVRGCDDPSKLDPIELARYFALLQGVVFVLQNLIFQTRDNLLDKEILASWSRIVAALSTTEGFKRFWVDRKFILSTEVQEFVENMMAGGGEADRYMSAVLRNYRPLGAPPINDQAEP